VRKGPRLVRSRIPVDDEALLGNTIVLQIALLPRMIPEKFLMQDA
jgi:hypothetical protein